MCVCLCESLLNSNLIVALVFVGKVGHCDAGRQLRETNNVRDRERETEGKSEVMWRVWHVAELA